MMRATASVIFVIGLGLAASGCSSVGDDASAPLTPLSRYSLQVEPGLDRIALAVHDQGLSANQQAALGDLAARYGAAGADWLKVETPAGNDPVAVQQAYAVLASLQAAGVPGESIQIAAYIAPDPRAPILVGFETTRARVTECSTEQRNLSGPRFSNQSSGGFGCAITANMAAQIADPRDILGARPMTPADSGRAAVVFDNYRKGQASSTPQEPLVDGRVSGAVE